jgi:hypothetical protein
MSRRLIMVSPAEVAHELLLFDRVTEREHVCGVVRTVAEAGTKSFVFMN